jgi:hypothetical protein
VAICNRWLAEDEDDGEIVRDLILKKEGTETKKSKEKITIDSFWRYSVVIYR